MEGESLYDEYGNYIGPPEALDPDELPPPAGDEDDGDEPEWARGVGADGDAGSAGGDAAAGGGGGGGGALVAHGGGYGASTAVVQAEDKNHYPSAAETYGDAVETLVQEEDAQPLSVPLVAALSTKRFSALEAEAPATNYTPEFLAALMSSPALMRNVALAGHLHAGKTTLADRLIAATRAEPWDYARHARYADARRDEQARGLSIKATPVSLVLQGGAGKSFLLNVVDTPGHVNFSDEATAAFRAVDGVVLVVDVVEGVMMNTERLVRHALAERLPIVLVLSKVDRLVLELKLPPADAYYKLAHTIAEVNALIAAHAPGGAAPPVLDPAAGNVAFAGAEHGWTFTLESFAALYSARWAAAGRGAPVDARELARRLWGDVWYEPGARRFRRAAPAPGAPRSFVAFVLEPLYKIYAHVLAEEGDELAATLADLGVRLRRSELHLDPQPLLRLVFAQLLGAPTGVVDMIVRHLPSPRDAAAAKVAHTYTGAAGSAEAAAMRACDAAGPLMANVVKLFPTPDGGAFLALARVLSGTLRPGDAVRVLGEAYTAEDAEDMALRTVSGISVGEARYRLEVTAAPAGCLVLLEGIDDVIMRTATLTSAGADGVDTTIFAPLRFNTSAVVKLAIEPLNPAELPKLVAGLRRVQKDYLLAAATVEETGGYVLTVTGELAGDCAMHDLRLMHAGVEVKVADPVVGFCESVAESSSLKCFGASPNGHNQITIAAGPLEAGIAADIEAGAIDARWERRRVAEFFQSKYGWDILAARSVWAFGPTERGPNVLIDDTLPSEVDKAALAGVRDSIVQGFQWGCREGPLCDEPIRGVKFKILDATIARDAVHRGGGQVIPTARRVAYSAFLLASPRLLEPVYAVEVLTPPDAVQAVYGVLSRRRGHVVSEAPKPGTPFAVLKALVPVIESFGFETDLRIATQGQAFGLQVFDHWAVVPGDPLDKSIVLRPLEPSPLPALAREFMVKTRRRKGLAEDVSVVKYFDNAMLEYLARQEEAMEVA